MILTYSQIRERLFLSRIGFAEASKATLWSLTMLIGYFPSASVAWKVSNEDFWASSMINKFKIRAGYGSLGAQNIPDYAYQNVFNLTSPTSVNNELVQGYAQTSLALEDLKWETSTTANIGIDVGMWEDKLTFSAEYYNKDVSDVLVGVNLPPSVGFGLPVIQNVGSINKRIRI